MEKKHQLHISKSGLLIELQKSPTKQEVQEKIKRSGLKHIFFGNVKTEVIFIGQVYLNQLWN